MKKLLILPLLAFSFSAFAQEDVVSYTDDAVVVDLFQACWNKNKLEKCDLNEYGIDALLVAKHSTKTSAGHYIHYEITSSVPMTGIAYNCLSIQYGSRLCGKWNGSKFSGSEYQEKASHIKTFSGIGVGHIELKPDYQISFDKLYFNNGIPTSLNASLSTAVSMLRGAYVGVNRNLESFRNEIAKSHRGHLDRLAEALAEGINLTSAKDEKTGKPKYSIVDWRLQENARLIVVFGTVLNELLTDYDDIDRLKTSINAMRTLVQQLRLSYGWDRGLAGSVSKASSSLIEVVRLELQELASIKMAMGVTDFKIYLDMLKVTRTLQAKVDASKSGDMKAQREIFDMLDLWNSAQWQDEMARLMNAGPDFKNLVIPKLSMLIFAIESIAELSDQEFIIPDRKTLK
ncbi:MAG: hypothetical protein ACLGHN_05195 [Bacteriovoracia bacterium]